jgi:hypothetical protein
VTGPELVLLAVAGASASIVVVAMGSAGGFARTLRQRSSWLYLPTEGASMEQCRSLDGQLEALLTQTGIKVKRSLRRAVPELDFELGFWNLTDYVVVSHEPLKGAEGTVFMITAMEAGDAAPLQRAKGAILASLPSAVGPTEPGS